MSGPEAPFEPGNALPLEHIPLGMTMHNVEMHPGRGGQLVRAAGTGATLVAKEGDYVTLRLPSGEMRLVIGRCYATLGVVGNQDHMNISLGKAGRSRWLGQPAERARRRHEPARPPARRRRGQDLGRTAPGHAVGPAHQGLQDAQEAQRLQPLHRQETEIRGAACPGQSRKVRSSPRACTSRLWRCRRAARSAW